MPTGAGTRAPALVELARALPDMEPDDGYLVIPPRPGTLTAPDAHWRRLAPQGAFAWLPMMVPRSPHARVPAGRAGHLFPAHAGMTRLPD